MWGIHGIEKLKFKILIRKNIEKQFTNNNLYE